MSRNKDYDEGFEEGISEGAAESVGKDIVYAFIDPFGLVRGEDNIQGREDGKSDRYK